MARCAFCIGFCSVLGVADANGVVGEEKRFFNARKYNGGNAGWSCREARHNGYGCSSILLLENELEG